MVKTIKIDYLITCTTISLYKLIIMQKIFEDGLSSNMIEIFGDKDKCIWLKNYYVDETNVKLFAALLHTTFHKYVEKQFVKLRQWVSNDDWLSFLHKVDGWNVVQLDNTLNIRLIECNIESAAQILMESFFANVE
jgi:hypothetical protein